MKSVGGGGGRGREGDLPAMTVSLLIDCVG